MEDFRIVRPSPLLAPYVKQYWFLRSDDVSGQQRIIPTGSVCVIFHRGGDLFSATKNALQPRAFVSGQSMGYSDLVQAGAIDMISVVFRPHGAKAFFPMPVSEFFDNAVSAGDLGDGQLAELQDRLMYTPDTAACVRLIEAFLLRRLIVAKEYDFARLSAVMRAVDGGRTDVAGLADVSCLSYKQFKRVFTEYVGANPKDFLRIVRFHRALHILQTQPGTDFAGLSFDCGFYDQPHLVKEFKAFSGYTPGEYLAACAPYSDYFS